MSVPSVCIVIEEACRSGKLVVEVRHLSLLCLDADLSFTLGREKKILSPK